MDTRFFYWRELSTGRYLRVTGNDWVAENAWVNLHSEATQFEGLPSSCAWNWAVLPDPPPVFEEDLPWAEVVGFERITAVPELWRRP